MYPAQRPPSHAWACCRPAADQAAAPYNPYRCDPAAGQAAVPCSSCHCETEEGLGEAQSHGQPGLRGRGAVREEEQSRHHLFAPGTEAAQEEERSHRRVCWKEPGEVRVVGQTHQSEVSATGEAPKEERSHPHVSRALNPGEDPGEQQSRRLVSGPEAGLAAERSHHRPSSPEVAGMEGGREEGCSCGSATVAVAGGTGEADSLSFGRHGVAGSGRVGAPRPRRRHSCYRNTWLALGDVVMW